MMATATAGNKAGKEDYWRRRRSKNRGGLLPPATKPEVRKAAADVVRKTPSRGGLRRFSAAGMHRECDSGEQPQRERDD